MTNCKYIVVRNKYIDGENTRISYGIAAIENCDGVISVLKSVSDVSSDFSEVENLVNICNTKDARIKTTKAIVTKMLNIIT